MKKYSSSYSCKSKLLNLTLLLKLHVLWSLSENHYGDCLPRKCGNLNIQYPFRILNQQESNCGYPGFEVSCNKDGLALFNMSDDTYVIKSIWYDDQAFQVVNSALVNGIIATQSGCLDSLKNVSLPKGVFKFATNHDDIFVFPNCSNRVLEENKDKRVRCGGVALYQNDSKLKDLEKLCNGVVTVPYYAKGGKIIDSLEGGMMLNYTAFDCTDCRKTEGRCGFDVINYQFNCYCPDRTHARHCANTIPEKHKPRIFKLQVIVATSSSLGAIMLLIVIVIIYAKRSQKFSALWTKGTNTNQNVETFLKSYGSLAPTRYTYAEIKRMTDNFNDRLGEGGYGTVYKGRLLHDTRFVAVKNLKKLKGDDKDFINEVVSIGRTNHVNIVTLLGFCFEGNNRALVYEFMPNGSLEKFIYSAGSGQALSSNALLSIAVGIGKGLDYLHRGCTMRILHFDIKPHNILLDELLHPKISDFGLARLCPTKGSLVSMSQARGTIGYIAPEVFCRNFGGVSHKSDVYSYGMMLLDLVCGRKNVVVETQLSSESYFPDWIYTQLELKEEVEVDELRNDEEKELHRKLILVGLWCIQSYPSNRPPMNRVIEMLEGSIDLIQLPPKPDLSSPPRYVSDSFGTPS